MRTRLRAILVGAAIAALAFGLAGAAWAQDVGCAIVLDPGHGGSDNGATYTLADGTELHEKDQNLKVAYDLKYRLVEDGCTVYMTRGGDPNNPTERINKDDGDDIFPDDATLSNNDRYIYANSTGADLLVSIHMNGSSDPDIDYTTTLYGKPRKDLALAQAVCGGLSSLLPAPPGTEGYIRTKKPYQYASGVLIKSDMPATIAETVFITNPDEAEWLASTSGERQLQIAQKLEEGILNYRSHQLPPSPCEI